jgi:O-succinylbenzoic acid--CoA ligase
VTGLLVVRRAILFAQMEHDATDATTPVDWIEGWAAAEFDRPCLVLEEGIISYGQLASDVHSRAGTLRDEAGLGEVVPVVATMDLPSIVDILAHMAVGAVPLPYDQTRVERPDESAPGAVVCLTTSGSAGNRRLVPLTMANLTASVVASRDRLGTGPDDRWLASLPLTHIGGLSVLLRSFEAGGAAVVGRFGSSTGSLIRLTSPTIASLVPTMVHRLLASDPEALASIGTVLVGGAALSDDMVERSTRAGVSLLPTYGMTETASQVATPSTTNDVRGSGWVGFPLSGFTVSIEPSQGDGPGHIHVDGPAVFSGYLGEGARSGPFATSDVGFMEPDGSLVVIGRSDDIVISGGENVALPAVRRALLGLDGVRDAAVVGVDDPEWGTAVCALVVTSDPEAVRETAKAVLDRQQLPRYWAAADRVPLLENGKVDVKAIRGLFEQNTSR